MPSSTVQMEDRSPMSLFLKRTIKRKSDDEVAEGASWEHELKQEVRFSDGADWCDVATCVCVCIIVFLFTSLTTVMLCHLSRKVVLEVTE